MATFQLLSSPARILATPVKGSLALLSALICANLSAQPPSPVTLAEVKLERVQEQITLTGTTTAWRQASLSVRVDGLVTTLLVDDGSEVEAGDPILTLDTRLAELDVTAASARLNESRATLKEAIRVRDELRRLKQGRHASESAIQSAAAQVEIARAAVAAARAVLARSEELLERHQLAAPFAGMVVSKQVELGEWVKRDEAAVELVSLEQLRVRASASQRDYPRIKPGAKVETRFDALPERRFAGSVLARIAQGDARTRTFPILIDLANPERLLAPGMSARVVIQLVDDEGAQLTVPRDAVVIRSDGLRQVWRVQSEGEQLKAHPITVEIGRANGSRLEIVSDEMSAGDRVVLLGNERLRPGQAVELR